MTVRTKNYVGTLVRSVRVYTNDPRRPQMTLAVQAFVKAPIYVSPSYVSFYSSANEAPSLAVEIKAGLEKALALEPGEFSLKGEVGYRLEEMERGRRFRVLFTDLPGGSETYRGYLNLKTNYPEKPVINIRIIGRFVSPEEQEKTAWSDRSPAS